MTMLKSYAFRTLWLMLPVVLLYFAYVCLAGWPGEKTD